MSSTIPKLTLFPLYPGGPMVRNTGSLNANSSFRTRATEFTPAYGVNIPPATNRNDVDYYYTLSGDQQVLRRPVSEARVFDTNLGLDGTFGGLKQVAVPAVAPTIPDLYTKAVELLSISDLKFSELMAQAEFRIPGVGMGLKVTTDGMGNVDTIALSPSSRGALPGVSAVGPQFGSPNMAEITTGATFKVTNLGFDNIPGTSDDPVAGNPKPQQKITNDASALVNPLPQFNMNQLNRNAGIFNVDRMNELALGGLRREQQIGPAERNPVLDRLYQMVPPENGLPVAGYDAALDADQARQLAATQAKLNVNPGEGFRQTIAQVVSASTRQAESYAAAFKPPMDQVMNGRVNVQPWQASTSTGQGGLGSGGSSAFEMGSAVADAMSRKSRGSYIPFRMQSDTQQGQAFAGGNPFMGAGTQSGGMNSGAGQQSMMGQFRQPRRPMAFTA